MIHETAFEKALKDQYKTLENQHKLSDGRRSPVIVKYFNN